VLPLLMPFSKGMYGFLSYKQIGNRIKVFIIQIKYIIKEIDYEYINDIFFKYHRLY